MCFLWVIRLLLIYFCLKFRRIILQKSVEQMWRMSSSPFSRFSSRASALENWEEFYGKSQGEVSHQVRPCMERSWADRVCLAEAPSITNHRPFAQAARSQTRISYSGAHSSGMEIEMSLMLNKLFRPHDRREILLQNGGQTQNHRLKNIWTQPPQANTTNKLKSEEKTAAKIR